jgi:ring-1,2-phenylacetyl-CoA epoxidase subunit PaaE
MTTPDLPFYKTLIIASIREEVKDFKTFTFEPGHGIHYVAGQYLTLVTVEQGVEVRRSYSITSAPLLGEPLTIGVKRVENGLLSRKLADNARPGDRLVSIGSGGRFLLPEADEQAGQLVFFAAGSGITPVFSLLKTALYFRPGLSLVLIYSNASPDKTAFLIQLQELQSQFADRFILRLLFSNASNLMEARLNRDLILHYLQLLVKENERKTVFYTCGPEAYMRLCTYTLQGEGIPPEQIKKESFFAASGAKRGAEPPDTKTYRAFIKTGGSEHVVEVTYPHSILRAAKQQGILLPYSCEAGRCANCIAQCTGGKVWHSYNEVLTEKELAAGLVLTCVGHPVGGDVHLSI